MRGGCPSVSRGQERRARAKPAQPLAAECPAGPALLVSKRAIGLLSGKVAKPKLVGTMAAEVMPMLSMSMSAGEHNDRHNIDAEYRATLPNVDKSKTKDNENIKTETIEQAYERVFGAAVEEHNARQVASGHPERQIRDYLAKVRAELDADEKKRASGDKWRKNRPDPCIEYVAQLGSHGTWASEIDEDEAKAILRETYERVRDRTRGAIDWFQAVIHVDETDGTPHMHMAGIAIGTGYKRGMPMRVSMRKAFETMGVKDLPAM